MKRLARHPFALFALTLVCATSLGWLHRARILVELQISEWRSGSPRKFKLLSMGDDAEAALRSIAASDSDPERRRLATVAFAGFRRPGKTEFRNISTADVATRAAALDLIAAYPYDRWLGRRVRPDSIDSESRRIPWTVYQIRDEGVRIDLFEFVVRSRCDNVPFMAHSLFSGLEDPSRAAEILEVLGGSDVSIEALVGGAVENRSKEVREAALVEILVQLPDFSVFPPQKIWTDESVESAFHLLLVQPDSQLVDRLAGRVLARCLWPLAARGFLDRAEKMTDPVERTAALEAALESPIGEIRERAAAALK